MLLPTSPPPREGEKGGGGCVGFVKGNTQVDTSEIS